ncbi:Alkaline phosphatase D [Mycena sanguinolenta]|uniref:Alkaline phosphatase D n=1 Tax=Mycena sanguinolenta TaxID=230812 RepID=A0A8H7D934_9AGAR|nr:Alkaline phosphatase D [Mycena sanguinolenta]
MISLLTCLLGALSVGATTIFDRNLAYRSPFADYPELAHNTRELKDRHIQHIRRQNTDAAPFSDDAYPTFYGSDFSNSPFVWDGGINFTHSARCLQSQVGDPLDTSVLIWTRAEPLGTGPDQSVPVCVEYKVFTAPGLPGNPIDSAQAFTSYDVDFTVKFEVSNLKPDTPYFYVFSDCTNPNTISPVGKTRTLPSPDTPANQVNGGKPLTLAVFSCSQFQTGWFNAYGIAAHNTSAEIMLHIGDYIYENVDDPLHGWPCCVTWEESLPRSTIIVSVTINTGQTLVSSSLTKIRRGSQSGEVCAKIDLSEPLKFNIFFAGRPRGTFFHKSSYTFLNLPQVADNSWKAGTTDSNDTTAGCSFSPSGACFTDRKLAAVRAYHEWLPVRQVTQFDQLRIWRNFQIGKLLDLTMLDTRNYDRDVTDVNYNHVVGSLATFANRSLMGAAQEKWFEETLIQSQERGATWRIVGKLSLPSCFWRELLAMDFVDDWDGYRANRQRILDNLYRNKITNTIILSGDSHANWVSDLAHPNDTTTYNPLTGEGAIGVEFAGTAVTSPSSFGTNAPPSATDPISALFVAENADLQWSEGSFRGFFTLTIDSKEVNATYYAMSDITTPNLEGFVSAVFNVKQGQNKLTRPVAGGTVAAGVLKPTNGTATNSTA